MRIITWWLTACLLLFACTAPSFNSTAQLKVVASTTLVGDVVGQVGGELIALRVLVPIGADPHTFEPRPQDVSALSDAQVVFINGLGLEEGLEPLLQANLRGTLVEVSAGIKPLAFEENHPEENHPLEEHPDEHAAGDPHTWMDPSNVIIWTQNIAVALSQADPANTETYQANADGYILKLRELDAWIVQQIEQLPPAQRKLVSDHAIFSYFAQRYGFEIFGSVIPSFSTNAAPSAQELAALEDLIRTQGVPAIFIGVSVNPALAAQIAQDTGIKLVSIYTGSLGEPGSGVESYLDFMRYNVLAIVEALNE